MTTAMDNDMSFVMLQYILAKKVQFGAGFQTESTEDGKSLQGAARWPKASLVSIDCHGTSYLETTVSACRLKASRNEATGLAAWSSTAKKASQSAGLSRVLSWAAGIARTAL